MKVSIIVPVYNVEQYLRDCIQSVLGQSVEDIELILVNDGSTDRSGKICDYYAAQYPDKVIAIHNENQGVFVTRGCGITAASGDLFLFLDSDDYLREGAIERLVFLCEKTQCDMIIYNASTEPDYSSKFRNYPFKNGELFEGVGKQRLYELLVQTKELNNLWLKAVKREAIDFSVDYMRLAHVKHGEDLLLSAAFLTRAQRILLVDELLYYYRQREGSIVHVFDKKHHISIKTVYREMEKYIDLWGMGDYHSKHYARVVRGWVGALVNLVTRRRSIPREEYHGLLDELALDEYFRNAYERMDSSILGKKEQRLARWLYFKNYTRMHVLYDLKIFVKRIHTKLC